MLSPDYLLHVSEGSESVAETIHINIINQIVKRIMLRMERGEDYLLTAQDKWQIETLQQAGFLIADIQKDIASMTGTMQTEIAEAMEEAGVKALSYDNKIYEAAGLSPAPLEQSPNLIRLMQRNYEATMGEWMNFTRTLPAVAQQSYITACDTAYNLVISGAQSYSGAFLNAVQGVLKDGVYVQYGTGRRDTIETATLRAVRTGVSQATAEITLNRMDEMDWDIVLVSSHLGARPSHAEWQGKFYSRSGTSGKYPPLVESTGYGTVTGLCGCNCRHSVSPGDGENNPYEQYDSEENKKEFELQQRQRTLERRIRETKRDTMGLKTALDNAPKSDIIKFEQAYQRKAALLQKQNAEYNQFCKENNLKKLSERLAVSKWDRQQAAAARGAAKRWQNANK